MTPTDNSVLCLMAPTASGKTALAYQLYETGRYELISVDSALIYRDMNIGTAKPTSIELQQYPHHLVDIVDPTGSYSVADFVHDVARLVTDIHARGKTPLLVGGTMMYYMALFEGLSPVPASDDGIRDAVAEWRNNDGIAALHQYLAVVDPLTAARLKDTDSQRITRAIEVHRQTGKPISYWQQQPKAILANTSNQSWQALAVMPDRTWLHHRIEQRLRQMWQQGLVAEVLGLLQRYPLTQQMPSMRCVGYRQVIDALLTEGKVTIKPQLNHIFVEKEAVDTYRCKNTTNPLGLLNNDTCQHMQNQALYATRQLAKRQYTWLRKLSCHPAVQSFATIEQVQSHLS